MYVESGVVLHSPMRGSPMRLDVFGGGVVDAMAYKGWPGLIFIPLPTIVLPTRGNPIPGPVISGSQ